MGRGAAWGQGDTGQVEAITAVPAATRMAVEGWKEDREDRFERH